MNELRDAYAACEALAESHYENFPVASKLMPSHLRPHVAALKQLGCRVSLFADAGAGFDAQAAAGTGADRIEIYTGPFAEAFEAGDAGAALTACADTARRAQAAGLGVNAGHDLSQANLAAFLAGVPGVQEVSIGHALIDESLYAGLDATVRAYLRILAA